MVRLRARLQIQAALGEILAKSLLEDFEAIFFLDDLPAFLTEFGPEWFVAQQALEGLCEGGRIARWDEETVHAVFYQVGGTAGFGADDGFAESHGFEKDEAETFAGARGGENVRAGVAGGEFLARDAFEEMYGVGDVQVVAIFFRRGRSSPPPTATKFKVGNAGRSWATARINSSAPL